MGRKPEKYFVSDDGIFPNSRLPILYYQDELDLPALFPARAVKKLFQKNKGEILSLWRCKAVGTLGNISGKGAVKAFQKAG